MVLLASVSLKAQSAAIEYYALLQNDCIVNVTDADAIAYINRVATAGYAMTCKEKNAINKFIVGLKSNNLWVKIYDAAPLMIGGTVTAAHQQSLKGVLSNSQSIQGGAIVSTSGVGPLNGTTQYINTTVQVSTTFTLNNTHFAIYSQSRTESSSSAYDISAANSSGQEVGLILPRANNQMYSIQYNETASQGMLNAAAPVGVDASGFWIGDRPSSTEHKLYRNGTVLLSQTTTGGPLTDHYLGVGVQGVAYNAGFSTKKYSYWSYGAGFTSTEAPIYTTLVNQLHTDLGINTF